MKRFLHLLPLLAALALISTSCDKKSTEPETEINYEYYYVNTFAYNVMNIYYLWTDEIASDLSAWKLDDEPIQKVEDVRYKDSDGSDIDRWTTLTDDFESFTSSVAGTSKTYGYDFTLMYYDSSRTTVCAVVTIVYPDSPAAKAGLKRGDVIMKVGGNTMTTSNYYDLAVNGLLYSDSVTITLYGGSEISMNSVTMYEDPVFLHKIFEIGDKKVGYLVYNSFTLDSCQELIDVCNEFKAAEVSELILDLRYNGGGYVITENLLASMLAPQTAVTGKEIYTTDVYNKTLTDALGADYGVTRFSDSFSYNNGTKQVSYSTKNSNVPLTKIYAIIDSGTASASESLITGLAPYVDIELIGEQTTGKYCAGIMYSAEDWYEDYKDQFTSETTYTDGLKYTDNWGIYVMISRYADKNGNTPCMPSGFTPDVKATDVPYDGYQLGDPNETMLAVALKEAGYPATALQTKSAPVLREKTERQIEDPAFGKCIKIPCCSISDLRLPSSLR